MKRKRICAEAHKKDGISSSYFPSPLRQGSDPGMILQPARRLPVCKESKNRDELEEILYRLHLAFKRLSSEADKPRGSVHHTDDAVR